MTFLYGFIVGAAAASLAWTYFHTKIATEAATLKTELQSLAKTARKKL